MPTVPVTGRHDLTDAQWAVLKPLLPRGKKPGRPPTWPRYGEDGLPVVHLRPACDQTCVLIEIWDKYPQSSPVPVGPGLMRSTAAASR